MTSRKGFTLIELLVVIAIIAILAVVVILTLNPAQLLAQSRDANRVSDLATLNSAIGLYQTDSAGGSMGTNSIIYTSLFDSSSTCGTLGLPALPSSYSYHCSADGNYRNVNGSGWIPINFSTISAGSPFGSLPVDPTNQTSSGLYYTYTTSGSTYQLIAIMESQKYKISMSGPLGAGVDVQGSNVGTGPVGYWPLDEGTGTIVYDQSGNGNNGTLEGSSPPVWQNNCMAGRCLSFDGTDDYINLGSPPDLEGLQLPLTIAGWFKQSSSSSPILQPIYAAYLNISGGELWSLLRIDNGIMRYYFSTSGGSFQYDGGFAPSVGNWHFFAISIGGSITSPVLTIFLDGKYETFSLGSLDANVNTSVPIYIGGDAAQSGERFNGLIGNIRVYDRALSPSEIQALYNAEK